ncbi:MAG TPA: aldo/keto reductase [Devosia sp.]|nr:aldo/keto reductase [Devosia sp.]
MPTLPNGAIQTSAIGIGCAYLTEGFDKDRDARIIHAAFDAGARHFDVAPSYGLGTAEGVLGRALKGRRNRVTIATKVGQAPIAYNRRIILLRSLAAPIRRMVPKLSGAVAKGLRDIAKPATNFAVASLETSLAQSLARLQTDYVDVLLLHSARNEDISDEVLGFLEAQRRMGRVRALGIATSREDMGIITAAHPGVFDVVQYSWSALDLPSQANLGAQFCITHRALMRALVPIQTWLRADAAARGRLSDATGKDLADPRILAGVLLGASLAENSEGITLAASRRVETSVDNVRFAQDSSMLIAGAKLVEALRSESGVPAPV